MSARPTVVFFLLLCCAPLGCQQTSAPKQTSDKPGDTTPPLVKPAPKPTMFAPNAAVKAPETIKREDVQAALQAWLTAQNTNDFEQYEALYAKRMTGVKRIKARVYSFDRAGWLADRKRMFKKKMNVSASKVMIQSTQKSAVVQFTQTWASGTFKDVGPKRLLMVKQERALRILREEMLSSSLQKSNKAKRLPLSQFAFVSNYHGKRYGIVLEHESDLDSASDHALESPSGGTISRKASKARVRSKHKALMGQSFALYGPKGKVCQGTVNGFRLIKDVTLHVSESIGSDLSGQARLEEIWDNEDIEQLTPSLIATLKTTGSCEGAWFARSSALPSVTPYSKVRPSSSLTKEIESVFLKSAQYKRFKGLRLSKAWWRQALSRVSVFRHPKDANKHMVYLHKHPTCEEPEVFLWQVWEAQKTATGYRLVSVSSDRGSSQRPGYVMAADLDGDRIPEMISFYALLKRQGTAYQSVDTRVHFEFECPC